MKLSKGLKAWAVKNLGVAATAGNTEFTTAIEKALKEGKLKASEYVKLREDKKSDPPPKAKPKVKSKKPSDATASVGDIQALIKKGVEEALKSHTPTDQPNPHALFGGAYTFGKSDSIRVKSAAERYSNTKSVAVYPERRGKGNNSTPHPLAGQPAQMAGVPLYHPSELDKAVSAAYFKFALSKNSHPSDVPGIYRMTEHDHDLVRYALHKEKWTGLIGSRGDDDGGIKVNRRLLEDREIKALLDDGTSGGIEAAPVVFDDAIILTPILHGELFPWVELKPLSTGRRVKGASMSNPTFTSGVAEGTAITPFNTSAFVSAFDTPIYAAVAAIEIGLDFEEDSPVAFGNQILEQYGLKALEWLDRVIAIGNGTSEPLGIFNASSITSVPSDNGAGGPLTASDAEGLMFGLAKQFRKEAGAATVFVSNDTMYRRFRSLPVGPGDERRLFGMDHASYMMLDNPHKIQNGIQNGKVAFVNLKRYRMYRRLGTNVRVETGGRTLALNNTKLMVVRMRFGGQMTHGGAVAIMTDAHN